MILIIFAENMCNLRGEASETALDISERVRMFSGVPLLVSNFWELCTRVSYPIPIIIISYLFPVLSQTQNIARRRGGGLGVRMLQRCQVQGSVARCVRLCISTLYIWGTRRALWAHKGEISSALCTEVETWIEVWSAGRMTYPANSPNND